MLRFICRRAMGGIITIFCLITITFFLTRIMPGNPFGDRTISTQVMESMEKEYGLNEPIWTQYTMYLKNLVKGDLGMSYKKPGVKVNDIIANALPATLEIGSIALVLSLILGILLGIWQSVSRRKGVKRVLFLGETLGIALPNFVVALLLLMAFGLSLHWFPVVGLTSPAHYILPVLALSAYPMATIARYTANAYEAQLTSDYVMLARSKGLGQNAILFHHILKNVLGSILNYVGPLAAFLLTGSFVVENIFTIPGLGREFVNSIANRDYTLIMGLTIFMGVVVILIQVLIDIICAGLDPRIRLEQS